MVFQHVKLHVINSTSGGGRCMLSKVLAHHVLPVSIQNQPNQQGLISQG